MPRKKASPVDTVDKPDYLDPNYPAFVLGQEIGNVSLAERMLDVLGGHRTPTDIGETTSFVDAAQKLHAKAVRRYARYQETQGERERSLREDMRVAQERLVNLTALLSNQYALLVPETIPEEDGTNGHENQDR